MKHRKLLVTVLGAALFLFVAGVASAQHGGGGHGGAGGGWSGGGGWHGGGGGMQGGGWHGGSGWQGGGWHGGSNWHGGNWHGGGCWNCGWRGNFGVWFGAYWWPAYYPYYGYGYPSYGYPYYSAAPAYVDAGPQVYIQRDTGPIEGGVPPAAQNQGQYTYYYCSDPAGYYPQVANCNRPWTKVVPNSPPPTAMPQ